MVQLVRKNITTNRKRERCRTQKRYKKLEKLLKMVK